MLKTLSFAIMHFSIAFTVAYLLTGDIIVGGLVALVEPAVNTVGYVFHEKIWQRLQQRKLALQSTNAIFKG
ncbi:DUF2061 domain-containing protein [Rheinheimera sp.]|uniref:DUF2061 domain-containing protein n=1 Tax=Rheinheimera sp. TaxID=1869214 RepID=UPI0027BA6E2A|nr:DUF2061 domain-containing protein [Rheinheimera sp.]